MPLDLDALKPVSLRFYAGFDGDPDVYYSADDDPVDDAAPEDHRVALTPATYSALVEELRVAREEVARLRAELFADDPAYPWRLVTFILLNRLGGDVTVAMDEVDAARKGSIVTNDPINPGRIYIEARAALSGGES